MSQLAEGESERSASDRYVNSTKAKCQSGWGNISMETIGPSTRAMMILLLFWLWVLLLGPSVYGSPLEIQLLEMMLREAEGYPSNGRDNRDISVLPPASIGCDDKDLSMMQAASIGYDESGSQEHFPNIFDDYEESEECLDFLTPCEPSFKKQLPVEHPCFVRLLLLRTPLLKEDPCANFSLPAATPTTTKKPKRKCNPKNKSKEKKPQNNNNKDPKECSPVNATTSSPICTTTPLPINSTTSLPICATPEAEPNSKIIKIRKLVPKSKKLQQNSTSTTTSSTTSTTMEPPTLEETTTPEEATSTTTEEPSTTTELETSTPESTTTSTTTTTQRPLTENQLKRYKAAQRRRMNRKGNRKGNPKVPDPPKIKIDGATQPSEVIQVIMTTEAAELRLQPEDDSTTTIMPTTTTCKPETTTEDSCEDEVETTKMPKFPESEDAEGEAASDPSKGVTSMEEPCEDTEEQDTNLCPQFMPAALTNPQSRPPAPYRSRKPVKNYVEPILYEGNFGKPFHRTTPIGPPQRDYIVSNKQIVPRPRPKYRKRIPHSIYMNNIVRGLDCSDEVGHYPSRNPGQPQRYWDMRRVGPAQRSQTPRKLRPERNLRSFAPVPVRRMPFHPGHSEESDEGPYLRDRDPEPHPQHLRYPEEEPLHEERPTPPQAFPTPSLDPCQVEHDHALYGERRDHHEDYPQTPASSHFFT